MKPLLFCLLLCFLSSPALAANDTLHIYFPADEAFMTGDTRRQIDKIADVLKGKEKLWLIGYADDRGDKYYNDMLSMRRAQSVSKYLQEKGIPEAGIKLSIGKGEINRWASEQDKQRADRRVDIIVKGEKPAPPPPPPPPTPPPPPPKKDTAVAKKIEAAKIGETLKLDNINFIGGTPHVLPTSNEALNALYEAMADNDSLVIRIEGHICCETEPQGDTRGSGFKLSFRRAETIYYFLIRKGIAKERLSYTGFSSWKRLRDPELTEEDRVANRRVEIRVINK